MAFSGVVGHIFLEGQVHFCAHFMSLAPPYEYKKRDSEISYHSVSCTYVLCFYFFISTFTVVAHLAYKLILHEAPT